MAHLEDHIKRGNGGNGLPSETDFHSGTRLNEQSTSNPNNSSNNNIGLSNVPKLIEPISAAVPEATAYNRSSKRKVIQKVIIT